MCLFHFCFGQAGCSCVTLIPLGLKLDGDHSKSILIFLRLIEVIQMLCLFPSDTDW